MSFIVSRDKLLQEALFFTKALLFSGLPDSSSDWSDRDESCRTMLVERYQDDLVYVKTLEPAPKTHLTFFVVVDFKNAF